MVLNTLTTDRHDARPWAGVPSPFVLAAVSCTVLLAPLVALRSIPLAVLLVLLRVVARALSLYAWPWTGQAVVWCHENGLVQPDR